MNETIAELRALAKSWSHERDRGWQDKPRGSGHWILIWDSGCEPTCKRCQLEAKLTEIEKVLVGGGQKQ